MDAGIAARIARLVVEGSPPGEASRVLEIGPGTGALTHALLESGAAVTAIDVDRDMIGILRSRSELAGAHIIEGDALHFDYASFAREGRWRVAGNLPYNIATPLIMRFVEMPRGPERLVVMLQKEVAERLAAKPGTRAYGSLSVAVQYAMTIDKLFTLKPGAFYPRPKIDSTLVQLTRRPAPAVRVTDERRFLQVVRAAFAYRRKTLANSLSLALSLPRSAVTQALLQIGLDTEIRGEQLGLDDFARLAGHLPG